MNVGIDEIDACDFIIKYTFVICLGRWSSSKNNTKIVLRDVLRFVLQF